MTQDSIYCVGAEVWALGLVRTDTLLHVHPMSKLCFPFLTHPSISERVVGVGDGAQRGDSGTVWSLLVIPARAFLICRYAARQGTSQRQSQL